MKNRRGEAIKPNEAVVAAVRTICNELNGCRDGAVVAGIVEALRTEHRTLKQAFWSSMLLAQIDYANADFDVRNAQSVELAIKVKELATQNNMDMGLPFI